MRVIVLCGITGGYYLLWLLGVPFVNPFPAVARRWRARNFRGWARTAARVVSLQINASNAPPVSPFLLVANHLTYVDIVVLESQVDCAFIAKKEVASWPILGFICRSLSTIFINRGQKRDILQAMAKAEQTLDKGLGVVLFAEGTSSKGTTVAPFKPSLLEFAARGRIPVHYATISYSVPPDESGAEQSVCWWNDMAFHKHIFRLLQLRRFEATVTFGPRPIQAEDRHVLAAELWSAVRSQFIPVTQHEPNQVAI
ncbi:MAG TPA: lysophospholipid acyltransferase family protein [Pyrinomonadaceae bacterium]|nr:lysophospholipid acyltransferase family protein [Pyrinomonadaceae bacterium]